MSIPASGYGGRGYFNPFSGERVIGVTTAIGFGEKPGILNWHIEQTAAFGVTHLDDLLSRTEEQGMGFLRYYTRRLTQDKLNDRSFNIYNYSQGVLDDLSELGDFMHEYVDADLKEAFEPEAWRDDQWQMIAAYLTWKADHTIVPYATELTLFGDGYGGTADGIGEIDGVPTLWDNKSARKIHDSHEAQLAALGACDTWAREVPAGTAGATYYKIVPSVAKHHGGQVDSWWVPEEVPPFSAYGVLQVRPDDWDRVGKFIPAHAEYHELDYSLIDAGWDLFQAGLAGRLAQRKRKMALKALGKKEEDDDGEH